jgi:tetratricopeptide (TPR) repeat protein
VADEAVEVVDDEAGPNRKARRGAAARARARRKREQAEAEAIGLDAGEMVDDALVRFTDRLARLLRKHWNVIQWVIGLGVLGWLGFEIYSWREARQREQVSDALFLAAAAENGKLGDPAEQGQPGPNGLVDPTRIFETDEARLQAALEAYRSAANLASSRPARALAQLGEAGVLLDLEKHDEASALYEAVRDGSEAARNPEIKTAAVRGLALSLEAKGDLPAALEAFRALAHQPGQETSALYEQARIQARAGETDAAKALLQQVFEKLGPPVVAQLSGGLGDRPQFLRLRAERLARELDPLENDVKIPKPPRGADAVERLLQQVREQGLIEPATPNE